jgi:hypothetical protein
VVYYPHIFSIFMNDLLNENDERNLGANIGCFNVGLLSYCDDLIILSPYVSQVNQILNICEEFANKWKLLFNVKKCNWYIHGNNLICNPNFILNEEKLNKVDNLIHLGLPNQKHVEEFFCD